MRAARVPELQLSNAPLAGLVILSRRLKPGRSDSASDEGELVGGLSYLGRLGSASVDDVA